MPVRDAIEAMDGRSLAFVSELTRVGVHPRKIARAVEDGALVSHGNGLLSTPAAADDPRFQDAAVSLFTDGGIVCRRTAASRLGLTMDLPSMIEVLVHDRIRRVSSPFPIQPLRSKLPASFEEGVETETVLGVTFRMTGGARTLADLWRSHRTLHLGVPSAFQQEALNTYLSEGGDPGAPIRIARLFDQAAARRLEIAVDTFQNHPRRTF